MTREKHDQLAKELFRSLLEPIGDVIAGMEVMVEPLKIDVTFQASSPLSSQELDAFGLPGRLISKTAYFEPYRRSLEKEHLWNGAAKLSMSWLAARRKVKSADEVQEGALWIVTPSASAALLSDAGVRPLWKGKGRGWWNARGWPRGLYRHSKLMPLGVIVLDELPEVRQTLTLRLLGRGRPFRRALAELKNLAPDDPLRTPVLHLLEKWHIITESGSELEPQDLEDTMHAKMTYQEWSEERRREGIEVGVQLGREEGVQLGREEGIQRGREEGIQRGREEGIQRGREEGIQRGREEGIQRGREEGIQRGREEGIQRGREEGIQRGRLAASKEALLRFWPRLYGDMPESLRAEIQASTDADMLEAAMNVLAQARTSDDVTQQLRLLLGR